MKSNSVLLALSLLTTVNTYADEVCRNEKGQYSAHCAIGGAGAAVSMGSAFVYSHEHNQSKTNARMATREQMSLIGKNGTAYQSVGNDIPKTLLPNDAVRMTYELKGYDALDHRMHEIRTRLMQRENQISFLKEQPSTYERGGIGRNTRINILERANAEDLKLLGSSDIKNLEPLKISREYQIGEGRLEQKKFQRQIENHSAHRKIVNVEVKSGANIRHANNASKYARKAGGSVLLTGAFLGAAALGEGIDMATEAAKSDTKIKSRTSR